MLEKSDKTMRYLQSRLRSGREIYETGYHVCEILQERDFNLLSDNRRIFNKNKEEGCFSDSRPFSDVELCDLYRFMGKLGRDVKYQRSVSIDIPADVKKHRGYLDTAVRKFIRSLFVNEYNLCYEGVFENYNHLLHYIYVVVTGKGLINGIQMRNALVSRDNFTINVNNISTLKRRHLKHGPLKYYREDIKIFVDNIVKSGIFPLFDVDGFLHKYMNHDVPPFPTPSSSSSEGVDRKVQLIIDINTTTTTTTNTEGSVTKGRKGRKGVKAPRVSKFYSELELDINKLKK